MPALIRRLSILLAGGVLAGAFYLQLIDTTSLPELIVLAGVMVACAIAFQLAREQGFVEASVRPSMLRRLWRLLAQIPVDVAVVCGEAVAQLVRPRAQRGSFREAPFTAIEDTRVDTGRRAVAETLGSVAPNTIVVGVDGERRRLLVHQLRARGDARSLDVMGVG